MCLLTDESIERLPTTDTSNIEGAYQNFCESLPSAAKQCRPIPRGRRMNYVLCWDKECETLYCSFTRAPVGTDSGRSEPSFHQCPVSANSIATQLLRNEPHRTGDRESTRLVNKELPDLWKIPTHEGHSISELFRQSWAAASY